jgi:hypothetical protein
MNDSRQAGRQAGRQVYVCTEDVEHLLRRAAVPDALLRCVVNEKEFRDLLRQGRVAAAVVDSAAATPELEAYLRALRSASVELPVVELTPGLVARDLARPLWADALVPCSRAHIELVPRIRCATIERVLNASARELRARFKPTASADVVLCSVPGRLPPFVSIEHVAEFSRCVPDTLQRHWEHLLAPLPRKALRSSALSLKKYVDGALLLRALAAKQSNSGWEHVATRLGTTRNRLVRIAGSHCAQPLSVLELDQPLAAILMYERDVLEPMGIEIQRRVAI